MAYLGFCGPSLTDPQANGSGGGDTLPQLADALFYAPMTTTIVPQIGSCGYSFSRAGTVYCIDNEGKLNLAKSGELRFAGARRVENLLTATTTLSTQSVTVAAGEYVFQMGKCTGSVTFSGAYTGSLAGSASAEKAIKFTTTAGSLTVTVTGSVLLAQLENVTGKVTQSPSEYVSVGVLSTPFHGCFVDGVKYFDTENANVLNATTGVITRIAGRKIPAWKLLGRWTEPARQNYIANTDMTSGSFTKAGITVTAPGTVTAPDGTPTALLATNSSLTEAHRIFSATYTVPSGSYVSGSIYVKNVNTPYLIFSVRKDGTNFSWMCVDTATWKVTELSSGGTVDHIVSHKIDVTGYNGWVRLHLCSYFDASNVSGIMSICPSNTATPGSWFLSYLGTGEQFYAWGPQCGIHDAPQMPVLTTGTAASNVADTFALTSVSGQNIASYTSVFDAYVDSFLGVNTSNSYRWWSCGPDTSNNYNGWHAGHFLNANYSPGAAVPKSVVGGVQTMPSISAIAGGLSFVRYGASFGNGGIRHGCNGDVYRDQSPYENYTPVTTMPTGTATWTLGVQAAHGMKNFTIWDGPVSTIDLARLSAPENDIVVFIDGDSLTAPQEGSASGVYNTDFMWDRVLRRESNIPNVSFCSLSIPSSKMRAYSGQVDKVFAVDTRRDPITIPVLQACKADLVIYALLIGTNEEGYSTSTQIVDAIVDHFAALKVAKPGLLCVSITNVAASNSSRTTLNNQIRDDLKSRYAASTLGAEGLANMGDDSRYNDVADVSNTTFYKTDLVHWTHQGHKIMGQEYLYPEIARLAGG